MKTSLVVGQYLRMRTRYASRPMAGTLRPWKASTLAVKLELLKSRMGVWCSFWSWGCRVSFALIIFCSSAVSIVITSLTGNVAMSSFSGSGGSISMGSGSSCDVGVGSAGVVALLLLLVVAVSMLMLVVVDDGWGKNGS